MSKKPSKKEKVPLTLGAADLDSDEEDEDYLPQKGDASDDSDKETKDKKLTSLDQLKEHKKER
jgi:hypothetical protein